MIKLELDEAFCFDLLSIAEVKWHKTRTESAFENVSKIESQIIDQIGEEKTAIISDSEEYEELYYCNSKIFDLVDEIKRNPGLLASAIDDLNFQRFQLKKALQEKFFPDKDLVEQKFGYKEGKE